MNFHETILNWIIFWIEFSWNNFELNIEFNQFWAKFKHWIESIWVSNRATPCQQIINDHLTLALFRSKELVCLSVRPQKETASYAIEVTVTFPWCQCLIEICLELEVYGGLWAPTSCFCLTASFSQVGLLKVSKMFRNRR